MFKFLRWFFQGTPTVNQALAPLRNMVKDLEKVSDYQNKTMNRNNKDIQSLKDLNVIADKERERSEFLLGQLRGFGWPEENATKEEGKDDAGN